MFGGLFPLFPRSESLCNGSTNWVDNKADSNEHVLVTNKYGDKGLTSDDTIFAVIVDLSDMDQLASRALEDGIIEMHGEGGTTI